jgi:hypothetical protein
MGALWSLGWRTPQAPGEPSANNEPVVEVELMRRVPRQTESAPGQTRVQARPQARLSATAAPASPAEAVVVPSATQQTSGGGAFDCAPEDLPLLTDAERRHCRNQIDAENGRRAAHGADERLARRLAALSSAPRIDIIPAEKRAYYDAVAAAYSQQSHGPPMAGLQPGVGCSIKFSGLTIAKAKPPPYSLHLGPCFIAPSQGFLTEESQIAPP